MPLVVWRAAPLLAASRRARQLGVHLPGQPRDLPFATGEVGTFDHQSTLGAFVGTTALQNNRGVMAEPVYRDGAKYLPGDAEVKALRRSE